MKKPFYVTTAIAYVNAPPHLGHAMEFVQADALARWHRLQGDDVFFLTGTDEHGTKIDKTARDANKTPQQLADEIAPLFQSLCKELHVSFDFFIRTTDKQIHHPAAQKIWKKLLESGDLYKKKYKGRYCVGCESFKTMKELENDMCPLHPGKQLQEVEEENYFFRLSNYQEKLIRFIETDEFRIVPKTRKNEILSFLKSGLEDVSFSRSKQALSWGIPVPDDPEQIMYVWCDALTNYISGIGYTSNTEQFHHYWPASVHIVGKDILRFHTAIWPAMLLSAKIPLPECVYAHGWITSEGMKMSKSLGNVVDPAVAIAEYGGEGLRYYLLREIPSGDDGDYSKHRIRTVYNSDLADALGNLLSRTVAMVERYCDGEIPKQGALEKVDEDLIAASQFLSELEILMNAFEFHKTVERIWVFIHACNKYINETKPWELEKTDQARLCTVLYVLVESLRIIAVYISPFLPMTAQHICEQIGQKQGAFKNITFKKTTSGKVKKGMHLFEKKEEKKEEKISEEKNQDKNADPFSLLDLRVASILDVKEHPQAEKLYLLQIDIGAEKKQIVAGLRPYYTKEELLHKRIVVAANMKPAKIRGEESNGMLLAADDGVHVYVLSPGDAQLGEEVFVQGIIRNPAKEVTIDYILSLGLIVQKNMPIYKEKPLQTKQGMLHVSIADGAKIR